LRFIQTLILTWANHGIAVILFLVTNFVVLSSYFDGYRRQSIDPGFIEFLLNTNNLIVVLAGVFILRDEIRFLYKDGGLELLHGIRVPSGLTMLGHLLPLFVFLLVPLMTIQLSLPFVPHLWWMTVFMMILGLSVIRGIYVSFKIFGWILFALLIIVILYTFDDNTKSLITQQPVVTNVTLVSVISLTLWLQSRNLVHD
jgi:hypothetical protein